MKHVFNLNRTRYQLSLSFLFALMYTVNISAEAIFNDLHLAHIVANDDVSQTRTVKGKVVDMFTDEPLIGAQIWFKDSPDGTITNIDGEFSLQITSPAGIIVISYIGYKTQEIPYSGQFIDCRMVPDTKELDEVVVVGYGTQKKESVVGSIASVKVKDLKAPVAKLSSNLGGQLSGVITLQNSGEPGQSTEFWIRGISTFGSNKTQLVLVDGI